MKKLYAHKPTLVLLIYALLAFKEEPWFENLIDAINHVLEESGSRLRYEIGIRPLADNTTWLILTETNFDSEWEPTDLDLTDTEFLLQ